MKHITVGVAGHIDHGKTALVRALTGIETDRLAEEQERGMSIALGFAHLDLPGGVIDVIDVPGHEKFVKTMIAGAAGIDAVLLIVAANERVKPQTVEHLVLTDLLGVRKGLVVLTKSDLVPDDLERFLAVEEVRAALADTYLHDAPFLYVSSRTGEGLDVLREHLQSALEQSDLPPASDDFLMPIDRVFSLTGHGTVVTGTLRRGRLVVGQSVEIVPSGRRATVRSLQVHGHTVEQADPGWRVAVNLRGIKKEDLERGDFLSAPDAQRTTRAFDAELRLLPTVARPLRRGQSVRLHYATREVVARIYPLTGNSIEPGETLFAQFRLADASLPIGERFVVRTLSPAETVGGGFVLDVDPPKRRRSDESAQERIQNLASRDLTTILRQKLCDVGVGGLDAGRFARDRALDVAGVAQVLNDLHAVACTSDMYIGADVFEAVSAEARDVVSRFHVQYPTRPGAAREEIRRKLPSALNPVVFSHLLDHLLGTGQWEAAPGGLLQEAGFSSEARLSSLERTIAEEIETCFLGGGLQPPNLPDVLGQDRRKRNLYHFLVRTGRLIPATDRTSNRTVVFHRNAVSAAERTLALHLPATGGLTVSQLNALLATTRKNSIPLLEHFDALGVIRRVGDLRVWNERSLEGGDDNMADTIRLTEMVSCAG